MSQPADDYASPDAGAPQTIVKMSDYDIVFTEPESPIELIRKTLPKNLTMWLFSEHTKWYSLDSYKFGEPIVTEDSLREMIALKDISAFAYAMYRTNEDDQGEWSDICDSIRIIFGVVELREGSMSAWLRTRYLPIGEIESPYVYADAPPFVLQSLRRPRLWVEPHQYECVKCRGPQYMIRNSCNTGFCPNEECGNFKLCTVTLDSVDFDTGPLNDLSASIVSKSVNADASNPIVNRSMCVKCKNCSLCKKSLARNGVRCKRHPICTHFAKRQRLI